MKTIIILTILLLASCQMTSSNSTFDKIAKSDSIIINSKVIIKTDTLDIINTSWLNNEVTLENGVKYNWNYVENKIIPLENRYALDSLMK